jgi:RNA polymerase sigma-70 factor (ECF subfamily)
VLTRRTTPPPGAVPEPAPEAARSGAHACGAPRATDAEVIACSLEEPGCFGAIFDRHAGEILRYAHARLGPDLAQDVLAETFLAAFGRRGTYDMSRADARPWLYGIAVRQIGRHRRAEQRLRRALARVPADAVTSNSGPPWPQSWPGCPAGTGNCCC